MNDTDQCPTWSMERHAGRRHACCSNEANQALEQLAIDAWEYIYDRQYLNARMAARHRGQMVNWVDAPGGPRLAGDSHPTARRRPLDHG
jgi:hypothetical protein